MGISATGIRVHRDSQYPLYHCRFHSVSRVLICSHIKEYNRSAIGEGMISGVKVISSIVSRQLQQLRQVEYKDVLYVSKKSTKCYAMKQSNMV